MFVSIFETGQSWHFVSFQQSRFGVKLLCLRGATELICTSNMLNASDTASSELKSRLPQIYAAHTHLEFSMKPLKTTCRARNELLARALS